MAYHYLNTKIINIICIVAFHKRQKKNYGKKNELEQNKNEKSSTNNENKYTKQLLKIVVNILPLSLEINEFQQKTNNIKY